MIFCHLQEIYPTNMKTNIEYCYKNRTRYFKKTASKNVIHKTVKRTSEFMGNKSAKKIVKPQPMLNAN